MNPMKAILFNIHDLVLVFVLGLCGLLALLSAHNGRVNLPSRNFLTAFFVLNAMIALDTLLFWGDGVKYAAFELSPWLLTLFSFAAFAFGPILYWVIRAESKGIARCHWTLGLHLIPALLTPFYLYWACYQFPVDTQRELILNLGVYSIPEAHFSSFMTLKKLSPVVYGILSVVVLCQNSKYLRHNLWDFRHLLYLTVGFTLLRLWILVTHWCGQWLHSVSVDGMGILSNYMTLALLAGVVLFCFTARNKTPVNTQTNIQRNINNNKNDGWSPEIQAEQPASSSETPTQKALSLRIQALIQNEKPYLNTRLNLSRFAEGLGESPRLVSTTINREFHHNFQEFINGHRLNHAKNLLCDVNHLDLPIIEIAQRSGFNSKATFNRLFKHSEGMSPTEYRDRTLSLSGGHFSHG